ncbi:MAG: hypothetical protein ACJ8LG_15415 [Massilia sp.]
MKSSLMQPAIALALVLGLSACGGKATFPVGVTVSGLQYDGLVLSTNNMDLAVKPPAKAGDPVTASFGKSLDYGEPFEVKVTQNPAHQGCGYPLNDRSYFGTAGQLAQINVQITCALQAHTIGGPVSGLTADGLVLANGSTGGTVAVTKDMTTFTFPTTVTYGVSYGVTVLTQPAGQVCTVAPNGTGVMGDANVTDIVITCK